MKTKSKAIKLAIQNIKKAINSRWIKNSLKYILFKIKKYIYDVHNFGRKFAWYDFLQLIDFALPKDIWNRINKNRLSCAIGVLEKKYLKLINHYKTKEFIGWENDKKIRVLWWQGIENAPKLIKKCVKSIEEYNCGYEVILLDKDNYKKYVELPDFIMKKVKKKKITLTHLSDIIRMGLLKKYWGIWVDATVFINSNIFKSFNDINLNSVSVDIKWDLIRRWEVKWAPWLIWWKSNRLFNFCYDFFIEYWKDYNYLIDYYLIDFVIFIAYKSFKDCEKDIDNISNKNHQIFTLCESFNDIYDEKKYNELMQIPFSKLSRKSKNKEVDENWNKTIYWKFVQETKG